MIESQNFAIEIAKIKNLPPLPEASIRIITAVNDPEISVDKLVEVISLSPALVARLLGLANSAYFGRAGKINDLRIAIIQVLGLHLVRSLALSIVLNVELDVSKCAQFDAKFFWSHALVTALIAQKASRNIDDELMTASVVYTSGLLLNIGLLAAVFIAPLETNEILSHLDQESGSVSFQMYQKLGLTQYDLGGTLLERWQLPDVFQTVVKEFRQLDFNGKEKQLIELLELSHWAGNYIVSDRFDEMPDFSDSLENLSLSKQVFNTISEEVMEKMDNIRDLATVIGG